MGNRFGLFKEQQEGQIAGARSHRTGETMVRDLEDFFFSPLFSGYGGELIEGFKQRIGSLGGETCNK